MSIFVYLKDKQTRTSHTCRYIYIDTERDFLWLSCNSQSGLGQSNTRSQHLPCGWQLWMVICCLFCALAGNWIKSRAAGLTPGTLLWDMDRATIPAPTLSYLISISFLQLWYQLIKQKAKPKKLTLKHHVSLQPDHEYFKETCQCLRC